jgi:hypothetical protein
LGTAWEKSVIQSDPQSDSKVRARSRWIGWSLCVVSLVFTLLALGLFAQSYGVDPGSAWSGRGALLSFFIFSVVGALIVSRQPGQLIGWIFCWIGLANEIGGFAKEYAIYGLLAHPGSLPGGEIMAWMRDWIWLPGTLGPLTLVLLLFPSGRLPSRRWLPLLWLGVIALTTATVAHALTPGPLSEATFVVNPFGIAGAGDILFIIFLAGFFTSAVPFFGAAVSLLIRLRRSVGQERKQLQWLASAASLLGLAFPVAGLVPILAAPAVIGASLGVPIAVGIAILRYRLFDIDIIIRRTLIYGALTAMLALVYFGSVVLLQQLFYALTGAAQSEIVTIISTLAIAALFNPLRRRVQDVIDHRFYRRKYDSVQVLAEFSAAARDEVQLEKLTGRLLDVVNETMHPTQVSLWLGQTTEGSRK